MIDYEFQRGDIVMKIGGNKKFLIKNVYGALGIVDAMNMENGQEATGDKDDVERDCIKVGTWNFDSNVEVDGDA